MKQSPLDHGVVYLNGADMKKMPWSKKGETFDSNQIILLQLLTAFENLSFFLGMSEPWLEQEIYEMVKS